MKKVILFLIVTTLSGTFAGEAIQVGSSSLSTATGFNNARKMARTLTDHFVIVYENKVNGENAIFINYSANGTDWGGPKLLDYGFSPAIAVSQTNSFYITYTKSNKNVIKVMLFTFDDLPDLHNAVDIDIYYGSPGARHASPTLDVGPRFVHLAFQSTSVGDQISAIRYGLFHLTLEPATAIFTLSAADVKATQPTLQTDLEYASDYVNLFWNEEKDSTMSIHHLSLDADLFYDKQPTSEAEFRQLLKTDLAHINDNFAQFKGCINPSVSVRTHQVGDVFANHIILGCDNIAKKQFNLFSLDYETDAPSIDIRGGFRLSSTELTWPSVDDIILNPRSCAIVWESAGAIFYGQSLYAEIVTEPPENISGMANSHYPSVCYKTFRSNVFDVIWTEGAATDSTFAIYYKRMDKQYWFDEIVIENDSILAGTYLHPFDKTIRVSGGVNSKIELSIVNGQLPDSLRFFKNQAVQNEWRIVGVPTSSGTIALTFRAVDIGDDVGVFVEKTITLDIENTAPDITVEANAAEWPIGEPVSFKISIRDHEGNSFTWDVPSLPVGLQLNRQDSTITGIATQPEHVELPFDTTFQITATDGDRSSTVNVDYNLRHATFVTSDEFNNVPHTLTLHPVYPNPFNPMTTVKLEVPKQQRIIIELYDVRGRRIKTVHNGELAAGFHTFTLDGTHISSGSYFIRMQSGDDIQTQKCVLLK